MQSRGASGDGSFRGDDRKRQRLQEKPCSDENVAKYRKLVVDEKQEQMLSCKTKYYDHLTEMYFLQTGGLMVDFPVWKKKPGNTQHVKKSRVLDSEEEDIVHQEQSHPEPPRHGKGKGVKMTAIKQEPDGKGSKSVSGEMSGVTPTRPGGDSINSSVGGSKDTIVERAKQEAQVLQRIAELRKQGLWSSKRLPKVQEPARSKAHWDYLLEEMQWLSTDFQQERKWKRAAARKIANMVKKYHIDKELAKQRAEKEEALKLRRTASQCAKMVKEFWQRVEKFIDFKQKTLLEEKRKQCLDEHLNFIVDQTEKYSTWLTEGMNQRGGSSEGNSPAGSATEDADFAPEGGDSDDEETIAKAEEDSQDEDPSAELNALKADSELPFDDLLKSLPAEILEKPASIHSSSGSEEEEDKKETKEEEEDEEFKAEGSGEDDEQTIERAEAKEKADYTEELADLEAENELSVEELMAKYADAYEEDFNPEEHQSDEEMSSGGEQADDESESEEEEEEGEGSVAEEVKKDEVGMEFLLHPEKTEKEIEKEKEAKQSDGEDGPGKEITDIAATAQMLQPTGFTLETTTVKTTVPFLLKHTLREYQHVGLDWLATLNESKLNGILADEMGLGKTIQTIALLAHLACEKGIWGPHLIVVPTSVMLNWELELKKWCPGFKILTYYGSQKERKLKRTGWTKCNAFHVCITSYKLAIQDANAFRRKKWKYFILDEAQNIKNFKSQRWQTLLNFNSQRRLLLTGTPLQNHLMELWSLMHFLMPHVFQSHKEFKEWFANPLTGMIEGNQEYNESLIKRLHKVLRPFLLRRLKKDVEKQMPQKYEHVVMCPLSKRQRFLYDDFMSQRNTRETLAGGHFMSVINILMQLRKVCNHPNLFDPRPIHSPFATAGLVHTTASAVLDALRRLRDESLSEGQLGPGFADLELNVTSKNAKRCGELRAPRRLIEEIDKMPEQPTRPRPVKLKFSPSSLQGGRPVGKQQKGSAVASGLSVPQSVNTTQPEQLPGYTPSLKASASCPGNLNLLHNGGPAPKSVVKVQPLVVDKKDKKDARKSARAQTRESESAKDDSLSATDKSLLRLESVLERRKVSREDALHQMANVSLRRSDLKPLYGTDLRKAVDCVSGCLRPSRDPARPLFKGHGYVQCWHAQHTRHKLHQRETYWTLNNSLVSLVRTPEDHMMALKDIIDRYVIFVPTVFSPCITQHVSHPSPEVITSTRAQVHVLQPVAKAYKRCLGTIQSRMQVQFPEARLIQYDCGKLQTLALLLRRLKSGGHRCLIFTQMTKMLNVLEQFLNYHGHIYSRLDGTTRVEQRQVLMDQFNSDTRIFCFILSTRSGGVGVNLTGADTVIFYDSDWNPTMDAQAQDRCHRIGQTRDVHIYRLVCEKTIEENILKKANQKRLLAEVSIEGGNFTTAHFKQDTIQDLFKEPSGLDDMVTTAKELKQKREAEAKAEAEAAEAAAAAAAAAAPVAAPVAAAAPLTTTQFEQALNYAEDEQDIIAADKAKAEQTAELAEFDESIPWDEQEAELQRQQAMSQAQLEISALHSELTSVEKYAVCFLETCALDFTEDKMKEAEHQLEAVKRDWELGHLKAMTEEEELRQMYDDDEMLFTYSRDDANAKVKKRKRQRPVYMSDSGENTDFEFEELDEGGEDNVPVKKRYDPIPRVAFHVLEEKLKGSSKKRSKGSDDVDEEVDILGLDDIDMEGPMRKPEGSPKKGKLPKVKGPKMFKNKALQEGQHGAVTPTKQMAVYPEYSPSTFAAKAKAAKEKVKGLLTPDLMRSTTSSLTASTSGMTLQQRQALASINSQTQRQARAHSALKEMLQQPQPPATGQPLVYSPGNIRLQSPARKPMPQFPSAQSIVQQQQPAVSVSQATQQPAQIMYVLSAPGQRPQLLVPQGNQSQRIQVLPRGTAAGTVAPQAQVRRQSVQVIPQAQMRPQFQAANVGGGQITVGSQRQHQTVQIGAGNQAVLLSNLVLQSSAGQVQLRPNLQQQRSQNVIIAPQTTNARSIQSVIQNQLAVQRQQLQQQQQRQQQLNRLASSTRLANPSLVQQVTGPHHMLLASQTQRTGQPLQMVQQQAGVVLQPRAQAGVALQPRAQTYNTVLFQQQVAQRPGVSQITQRPAAVSHTQVVAKRPAGVPVHTVRAARHTVTSIAQARAQQMVPRAVRPKTVPAPRMNVNVQRAPHGTSLLRPQMQSIVRPQTLQGPRPAVVQRVIVNPPSPPSASIQQVQIVAGQKGLSVANSAAAKNIFRILKQD